VETDRPEAFANDRVLQWVAAAASSPKSS
jgi:hypothetical protein